MRGLATPPRLPRLTNKAQSPTGPRFVPREETIINGPGQSPAGFVSGKNSEPEWWCYWALSKIFNNPRDPRKQPFEGGMPDWAYQVGRGTALGISGATNIDFVVYQGGTLIGIRVQSERYHVFVDGRKHAYDAFQRAALESSGVRVVDIYEEQILGDPSGQKVIISMKQMIGRLERVNPVLTGGAIRASRLKVIT